MNIPRIRSRLLELCRHPGFRRNPPLVMARIMAWAVHCGLGVPARIRLRHPSCRLYLPAKWRGGGSTSVYVFRELYEPEFLALSRLLRPGMVFVDGGANTGAFTFAAARLVGSEGKVLAFEPGRRCFLGLQESARLNACSHVILRAEALADESGPARLYHHASQDNSFSLGAGEKGDLTYDLVQRITLSDALQQEGLTAIDFLKLDIEGAQELALRGCLEQLQRDLPHVLIENHQRACRRLGLDPLGAFQLLEKLGYAFYQVDTDGELQPLPSADGVRTVLAMHPHRRGSEACGEVVSPVSEELRP
jgi:FkbM family methyltransferase